MKATAIAAIEVLEIQIVPGDLILITSCPDYDAFESLPRAVNYEGRTFGLTGWNSDRGHGYYKTSRKFATPLN
jgi:hypothetical protein